MYIFQPDRHLLRKQIEKSKNHITGRVLDVGAGEVNRYQHYFNCDEYIKMDIEKNDNIDIIGAAENIPFDNNSFDSIVCTQVLGDIKDIQKAIFEFKRVLKPDGKILLTESFINEMHNEPHDYWRFTKFTFNYLFSENGFNIINIDQRGGFFTSKAQNNIRFLIDRYNLYKRPWTRILNPIFKIYSHYMFWRDLIDQSQANKKFTLGWCVVAQKKT